MLHGMIGSAMDFLRLTLLLALLSYGAVATDYSRALIRTPRHRAAVIARDLTREDSLYIKQLIGLASVRPASMLVQDGVLLGTGLDRQSQLFKPTAHAETEAIQDACKRAKKSVLKDGVLYASRQPCSMCMHVIARAGIAKVVIVPASRDSSARSIRVPVLIN